MAVFLLSSAATTNRFVSCFTSTTRRIISDRSSRHRGASFLVNNYNNNNAADAFGAKNTNTVKRQHQRQRNFFMSTVDSDEKLSDEQIKDIEAQIKSKGDEIRQLKADGIDKESLAPHVAELIALKSKIAPPEEPKKKEKKQKQKQPQKKKPQPKKEAEMSESELRAARLQKAELMREAGAEPYEYSYDPTHKSAELQVLYEGKLEGGEEDEEADVAVAGRIMAKRVFGKLAFFTLQDESGTIQLHLEKNRLGDTFKVGNFDTLIL